MKKLFPFVLMLAAIALAVGCASAPKPNRPAAALKPVIITPDLALAGKVVSVNVVGRFVVLGLTNGEFPKLQQTLFLYRAGLKVGEVRVTGPQSENNTVADLISGEAKVGDAVRDR